MPDHETRDDRYVPAHTPHSRPLAAVATAAPASVGRLRATMAETATLLAANRLDTDDLSQVVVHGAWRAIPHLRGAAMTTVDRSGRSSASTCSNQLVEKLEQAQVELGEGPVSDALHDSREDGVHAADLGMDLRWPTFSARAIEIGVGEVLSVRVATAPCVAVLTLYGGPVSGLDDHDRLVAALYADQVAVVLAGAHRVAQLTSALESRDVIGRAKGILIERFGLTDQEAFARLAKGSQAVNMKLRTVAEWFVRESENDSEKTTAPTGPPEMPRP